MGIIVNLQTGEFLEAGDIGNLCEKLQAMVEMEMDVEHLAVYAEDDAYAVFG